MQSSSSSSTTTTKQPSSSSSSALPTHTTQSMSDRIQSRNEHVARASGQLPPEVDVNTGSMINPHNPEFITKKPWYLGGDSNNNGMNHNNSGPTLDHQTIQKTNVELLEYNIHNANEIIQQQRQRYKEQKKKLKFKVGMYVEALYKNKKPYRICQIIKIAKNGTVFDLKYDNGIIEYNVKMKKEHRKNNNARIRLTKMGNRSLDVNPTIHGKETYDSKRDKYHGYEIQEHLDILKQKYAERDAIRKQMRNNSHQQQQQQEGEESSTKQKKNKLDTEGNDNNNNTASDSDSDYDSDAGSDSDDEFVQKDADAKVHVSRHARQGGVGGNQMKVTARNLRIREDTAKYLHNLDPNSAYYDPKSRSMRDNPNPEIDPSEANFAGDNFARISGDAVSLAQTQVFAWDMEKAGGSSSNTSAAIHLQANPSLAETLKKQFTTKEVDLMTKRKKAVLDKYGGAEYLDGEEGLGSAKNDGRDDKDKERAAELRKVRFGVTVKEEVYSRDGRPKSGAGPLKPILNQKSKYEEDLFINGHNTVWGSYFHKGAFRWGYADDHSLMKNSYCTGAAGRAANDEANAMRYGTGVAGSAALAQAAEILKTIPVAKRDSSSNARPTNSQHYGEADQFVQLDEEKLKKALNKNSDSTELSKRRYNSVDANVDVTAEDMEAYRLKRQRADDPLAKLADTEEILEYK